MKFYDRTNELKILEQIAARSAENACFTVMVGRRRIGKTALLLRWAEERRMLYLFVSRNSEAVLCDGFQQQAADVLGVRIYGTVSRFRDLFEQLLIFAADTHYTLIIDEFQEFDSVNAAVFSEIQDLWDRYKDRVKMNLIVCGSIYSLMTKIFEHQKEPLFGRMTSKIVLKPFTISVLKEILGDYNPAFTAEDLLFLYTVTDCIPQYVALLMNAGATSYDEMLDFTVRSGSPFLSEGKDLLVSEFGRDYGTYFSIIQLIAAGKTTQSEIDSIIGKNTGAYLANLENQYSLIVRNKPLFSKPESRKARWSIDDNFLRFWFRFIYPNQTLIEMGKFELLKKYVSTNYEQFSGLTLEKYFRRKFVEEENVTLAGNYWDNRGENEIDLIALNDFDKTAVVAEIKRNPNKINLQALTVKAAVIRKHLPEYEMSFKALSMDDM